VDNIPRIINETLICVTELPRTHWRRCWQTRAVQLTFPLSVFFAISVLFFWSCRQHYLILLKWGEDIHCIRVLAFKRRFGIFIQILYLTEIVYRIFTLV